MSAGSLGDFLDELEASGHLSRTPAEVASELEIAEIARRAARQGGPALVFSQVAEREFAAVVNLWATMERALRALGVADVDQLARRWEQLAAPQSGGWLGWLSRATRSDTAERRLTKPVKTAAVQQVVRLGSDVDLRMLPALRCWSQERRAWLAPAQVVSDSPTQAGLSVVARPAAVIDATTLAIVGLEAFRPDQPVAVCLGGEPDWMCLASMPIPREWDALELAAAYRNRPLDVVRCRDIDLSVPAQAELAIEGVIDLGAKGIDAGPWLGPTGQWINDGDVAIVRVKALTHRARPILPLAAWGESHQDGAVLARLVEPLVAAHVRGALADVASVAIPPGLGCDDALVVSIDKSYARQGRRALAALWSMAPSMSSRLIVVVDREVDVRSTDAVVRAISTHATPAFDFCMHDGPSAPLERGDWTQLRGRQVGIDATRKLPGEPGAQGASAPMASDDIAALVERRWQEYALTGVRR